MVQAPTQRGLSSPSTSLRHQPAQVAALDVLHREEQALVAEVLKFVYLDDVRVIQARGEVRLLDEHRAKTPRFPGGWARCA